MSTSATTIVLFVCTILCTSAAQVFQKRAALRTNGMSDQSISKPSGLINSDSVISACLLAAGLLLWLFVLERMAVSVAYPLLSVNYIVVLFCARIFFDESIPVHRWVGVLSILAGIYMLAGHTWA